MDGPDGLEYVIVRAALFETDLDEEISPTEAKFK